MSAAISEHEFETLEGLQPEAAGEGLHEHEHEQEQFFSQLLRLAGSPAVRRLASQAAQAALGGLSESGELGEIGESGELGEIGEFEDEMSPVRRAYPDGELEDELAGEMEISSHEAYAEALMEHLASAAAEAETEAEADRFFPLLMPLASAILPKLAPMLARSAPNLVRGISRVGRQLFRNRRTRPLIRTLPTIVRRTAASLARQGAPGRPLTSRQAVNTLARQTATVLGNPRLATRAFRRSRAYDRRFHTTRGGIQINIGTRSCPQCGARVR